MDAFSRLKARLNKGALGSNQQAVSPDASRSRPSQASISKPTSDATPEVVPLPPQQHQSPSWPIRLVSPHHRVQITVYHYMAAELQNAAGTALRKLHVWVFLSSGLHPLTAGELVMVVQQRSNESPGGFPTDFIHLCDSLYERASSEPLLLERWKLIDLDTPLFGRQDFKTIALSFRNSPLVGLDAVALDKNPIPHFHCLALGDQEAAVARRAGVVRALVLLDLETPCFPFPFYIDRDRQVSVAANQIQGSTVASGRFHQLEVTGLNVIQAAESRQVTLHIPRDKTGEFKAAMIAKQDASISNLLVMSQMHDGCDGVYLWKAGTSPVRTMTSRRPTNVAANFLIISFNQPSESVKVAEDGLLVLLNADSTVRFFLAACNGQELILQPGGVPFRLSWPPAWEVPAFSNMSGCSGILYLGSNDAAPSTSTAKSHVKVESIVLIHEPTQGTANANLFAEFISKAEAALIAAIPDQKPAALPNGCGMMAQFRIPKLTPKSFKVEFMLPSQEAANAVPINEVQRIVEALEAPEGAVYGDYIEAQILFSCWGFKWSWVGR